MNIVGDIRLQGNQHSASQSTLNLNKYTKYRKFSNVNQVIYSSAPTSIPNMKALALILFEISCTQDFQILFSKGHNSEKGHNLDMKKKYGSTIFS